MTIVGLDPTSGPLGAARAKAAPRRASLDGVVIGLISNGLGESDAILAAIGDEVHGLVAFPGACKSARRACPSHRSQSTGSG